MSHVLFLLLVLAETAVAHATIPDGWWFLLPGVVSVLLRLSFKGGTESGKGGKALLSLHATDGTIIRYYYWFLVGLNDGHVVLLLVGTNLAANAHTFSQKIHQLVVALVNLTAGACAG